MEVVRREQRAPYTTPDGSTVQEIAGPAPGDALNRSLAEATVRAGGGTIEHYHRASEEIYRFLSGAGRTRLAGEEAGVRPGDVVVIPAGTRHRRLSIGRDPLLVLCCSAPPYSHEDTVLCE